MLELTANGICHNIKETPYKFKLKDDLVLHFSSALYLQKFEQRFLDYAFSLQSVLRYQYSIDFDTDFIMIIAAIKLYNLIEKRGFYIILKGEIYNTWQEIPINYLKIIIKSYKTCKDDITEQLKD